MEAAGRDPATVERTVSLLVDLPTATGRPSEEKPGFKPREPEELAAHLASYADAGISHVQLMLDPNTPAGIEWAARSLEMLDAVTLNTPSPSHAEWVYSEQWCSHVRCGCSDAGDRARLAR